MSTKIKIRADSVEIEGYVNAVERASKPLRSRIGQFIERICKGAFAKALKRNDDVHILLNHDWQRDLGSTKKGNLELEEDSIGLKARATITDPDVVTKAKNGDLVGWSFGFTDKDVENSVERGMPLREVRDLNLYEVSILDRNMSPAYEGTLVSARSIGGEEQIHFRGDDFIDEMIVEGEEVDAKEEEANKGEEVDNAEADVNENAEKVDIDSQDVNDSSENEERSEGKEEETPAENTEEEKPIDYSEFRNMIKEMKED